jgi:hypothetical protein
MKDGDSIIVRGAVAEAEVIESQSSYHKCVCGHVITVSAGMVNSGDSLKIAGSTTTCPSCGKAVNLN